MTESEAMRTLPIASLKYIPNQREHASWVVPADDTPVERDSKGLAIPPDALLIGYADNAKSYLDGGAHHARTMRAKLHEANFALGSARRILDFGCGIGRIIRHLADYCSHTAQIWGVDISSPHIQWCKWYLSPPYCFATTTTIPHLPFPDGHFDVIYAASVFTHIEDLADAWLLEICRILSDRGCAYITVHDEHTIELLNTHQIYRTHWLGNQLRSALGGLVAKKDFGMLVIDRDVSSQVFYSGEYFGRMVAPSFQVAAVHRQVHGYQTAYVLVPRR